MKKEYVSPRVDIIYTRLESELLAGSDGLLAFLAKPIIKLKPMTLVWMTSLMNLCGMMKWMVIINNKRLKTNDYED